MVVSICARGSFVRARDTYEVYFFGLPGVKEKKRCSPCVVPVQLCLAGRFEAWKRSTGDFRLCCSIAWFRGGSVHIAAPLSRLESVFRSREYPFSSDKGTRFPGAVAPPPLC